MSKPTSQQFFEQFQGKDNTSSPLSQDVNSAIEFSNLEKLFNGSLRGRQGLKLAAQPMYVKAVYPYIYTDSEGVVRKELIGIGLISDKVGREQATLVRLKSETITINYSGMGSFTPDVIGGPSPEPNNCVKVHFNEGNGLELVLPGLVSPDLVLDLGTGYEASPVTLKTVTDTINALADWSCSLPPKTAVINGAQSGTTEIVTVDSGHTFAVGDWFYSGNDASTQGKEWKEVVATTATTIELEIPDSTARSYADNEVVGHGLFPGAILDLYQSPRVQSGHGPFYLTYSYWEIIPCSMFRNATTEYTIFKKIALTPGNLDHNLPVFANRRNCLYFTADYAKEFEYTRSLANIGGVSSFKKDLVVSTAGLWKYDGKDAYLSGFPFTIDEAGPLTLAASASAGTLDAGTYLYEISFLFYDAQNNEFEWFDPRQARITTTTQKNQVTFYNASSNPSFDKYTIQGFNIRSTTLTAGVTATDVLPVTSKHLIRTGDYVFFIATGGARIKAKVLSWTKTSITIDQTVTAGISTKISTVLTRYWRTQANGSTLYLLKEEALVVDTVATRVYDDDTASISLGVIQSAVKPALIQYTFPKASALTEHQDVLVLGGGSSSRQLVQWEDVNAPESSSKAINNTPIPTSVSGDITALVSSQTGALLVVKPTAQYEINGSLSDSSVEVTKLVENGEGSSAQSAINAFKSVTIGAGNLGIWASSNGLEFGKNFLSIFRERDLSASSGITLSRIVLAYDSIKDWIHIFIPVEAVDADGQYVVTGDSRHLVYMISPVSDKPSCWAEFTYTIEQLANAGLTTVDDTFYQQSFIKLASGDWTGFLHKRLDSKQVPVLMNDYMAFADNGMPYDWEWLTSWDDGGDPKVDKTFEEFVLYCLQHEYVVANFDVAFKSYRDWSLSVLKFDTERVLKFVYSDTTPGATFTCEDQIKFDAKYKAKRRAFHLSGTVFKNPPVISGYEYTTKELFAKNRMTT